MFILPAFEYRLQYGNWIGSLSISGGRSIVLVAQFVLMSSFYLGLRFLHVFLLKWLGRNLKVCCNLSLRIVWRDARVFGCQLSGKDLSVCQIYSQRYPLQGFTVSFLLFSFSFFATWMLDCPGLILQ